MALQVLRSVPGHVAFCAPRGLEPITTQELAARFAKPKPRRSLGAPMRRGRRRSRAEAPAPRDQEPPAAMRALDEREVRQRLLSRR
jgi:hypothetical protein